ncbi:MAG: ATP-binding protein [Planctomycetota bacterium]|nr:ATP-binding protein [Planctomycetota bacterium]
MEENRDSKEKEKAVSYDSFCEEEILKALMSGAGLDEEKARQAISVFKEAVKKALISGKRVVLPDFASFYVTEQKASICRDPQTGVRYISPARKVLTASVEGKFKGEIEASKLASILLVVPRNDPFAKVVDFHFSRVGWRVFTLNSPEECLKKLSESEPYLCIVDYALDGAPQLVKEIKCNIRTSMIPVIVLFPRGKDPERAENLRICGDEHLAEPFEVYTLLTLAESELARLTEEEVIFRQQFCIQLPTDEGNIEESCTLLSEMFRISGMKEEGQVALNAAVREALLNAAQHGNRYDRNKQIRVLYLLDREKVTVVISDEGDGFDYNFYLAKSEIGDAVSAARERYQQGRLGGLGIMLMSRCADRLEYNDKGNSITLTKYIERRPETKDENEEKSVMPRSSEETVVVSSEIGDSTLIRSDETRGQRRKRATRRRIR